VDTVNQILPTYELSKPITKTVKSTKTTKTKTTNNQNKNGADRNGTILFIYVFLGDLDCKTKPRIYLSHTYQSGVRYHHLRVRQWLLPLILFNKLRPC
jgi:hypothetical protein